MGLLGGRWRERGGHSTSGAERDGAAGESVDRLTADRLAGVLSLLDPPGTESSTMRLPPGVEQRTVVPPVDRSSEDGAYWAPDAEDEAQQGAFALQDDAQEVLEPHSVPEPFDSPHRLTEPFEPDAPELDARELDARELDARESDARESDVTESAAFEPKHEVPRIAEAARTSEVLVPEVVKPKVPLVGRHRRPARGKRVLQKMLAVMGFGTVATGLLFVAVGFGALKTLG